MSHTALPDGCPHIMWQWEIPADDPTISNGAADRGALLTQFATWTAQSNTDHAEALLVRRRDIAAQGLLFAEAPHLCQVDRETGRELWAVPLTPDLT